MTPAPEPITVFAALGPNPASLVELIWALERRGSNVRRAHVVVDARAHHWLVREVLGRDGALAMLRASHPGCLPEGLEIHTVTTPEGELARDDADPADFRAYVDALWAAAITCLEERPGEPVVFGLCAGRRRSTTALMIAVYSLLARARDRCVDVRVSDMRAEGATGFFFPDQPLQQLRSRSGEPFVASAVEVHLVEMRLPKLRGLLRAPHLVSYDVAFRAGEAALLDTGHPEVTVDLRAGRLVVGAVPVALPPSQFLWYATLAEAAQAGVAVAASDRGPLRNVAMRCSTRGWFPADSGIGRAAVRETSTMKIAELETISQVRSKTKKSIAAWCADKPASWSAALLPRREIGKHRGKRSTLWRVGLDAAHLRFVEADGSTAPLP